MIEMEGRVDRSRQIDLAGENEEVGEQISGNKERREHKEHQLGEKDAPENRRIAELLEPEELPRSSAALARRKTKTMAQPESEHCQKTCAHARSSQIEVCIIQQISRRCAGAIP